MASEPPKVFISYNRADRDWAEWIAGAIESAGYEPIIQAWHFRPGQNFVLRMQEAMADSDLTITVLSEDYLKAEFTQSEWAAAFARDPTGKNRKLIPVRVGKCHLPPILSEIIYIDLVGQAEQDADRSLLDGLKPSGKPAQPPPFPGKRAEPSISTAPFPPSLARLHGVPDLPPHYLPREEALAGLKQKLLAGGANVGITGQFSAVGVQGMGGIGKSVLAAALAHDLEVRQAFPDGIYWLTVGQKPNVLDLQNQLLRQLTGSKETSTTEQEAKDALRQALEGRSALVVVDDAWTIDHADAFSVTAPPARLIITTRNNEVLVGLEAEEHRVDVLSLSNALKMLAEWVGEKSLDKLPAEAVEVAKECGYLPLALAMIGAMIRSKPSSDPTSTSLAWKDALTRLRRRDLGAIKKAFPNYPYPNLFRAIEVSVEVLDSADRERYLDLAVFPEDQPIPEEALRVLWNLEEVDTRDYMRRLAAHSLARLEFTPFVVDSGGAKVTVHPRELMDEPGDDDGLILHDLLCDFIRIRRKGDIPAIHARLVESWGDLTNLKDKYAWSTVVHHLSQCGRNVQLEELLLNFRWLEAKLRNTDPEALLKDFDNAPPEPCFTLIAKAIRHSMESLKVDRRQLAGQLVGRLLASTETNIEDFLGEVAKNSIQPWIRPLRPSLDIRDRPIAAVAIAPDGRRVVLASSRTLRVLDLGSGQTLHILEGHKDRINAVAITPDGRHAVSASRDTTLRVWDINTGQTLRTLKGHTSPVQALAITPDGTRVVTGSGNEHLFELLGFDCFPRYIRIGLPNETAGGSPIRLEPSEYALRVWDLRSGQLERILNAGGEVNAIGITPDGSRAVSASKDVRLWELKSGATVRTLQSQAETVAVTPDGRRAVLGGWHGLAVWDFDSGRIGSWLGGIECRITALRVRSDGRYAISVGQSKTLSVWDLSSLKQVATFTLEHPLFCCAVAPDGRTIVIGDGYGRAHFLQFVEADETKSKQ